METSELQRYAQGTGRNAPRLQAIPGASSFPRKREPTGGAAYAKAGTYPNAARPDRSTLSRRVRGVLSPYRERGMRRLRAFGAATSPQGAARACSIRRERRRRMASGMFADGDS